MDKFGPGEARRLRAYEALPSLHRSGTSPASRNQITDLRQMISSMASTISSLVDRGLLIHVLPGESLCKLQINVALVFAVLMLSSA